MLLANMAVAHRIHKSFPDLAVLRRHPPPQVKMIDNLVSNIGTKASTLLLKVLVESRHVS